MVILPVIERVTRAVLVARGTQSRHVHTKVGRLHLYDTPGAGTLHPVVMLHGIATSAAPFAGVSTRLRPLSRRILAPDAPGHGLSDEPLVPVSPDALLEAITQVLDRELEGPAVLVGCSLGGALALRYALLRPERVAALVLGSPAGAPVDDPDEYARFLRSFELADRADARDFFARLHHEVPWYAGLLAPEIVRVFARPAVRSLLSSIEPEHFFKPEELAALALPIHVIWGRSDRIIPATCLDFFKKHLPPHASFEEPEGVGHSPHLEAPTLLVAAIERKLRELAARA